MSFFFFYNTIYLTWQIYPVLLFQILYPYSLVLEMFNIDGFSVDSGVNVLVCLLNISSTLIITDGFVLKFSCTIVSWD